MALSKEEKIERRREYHSRPEVKLRMQSHKRSEATKARRREQYKLDMLDPEFRRNQKLNIIKHMYGLSREDYLRLEQEAHEHGCPVCKRKGDLRLHVDHDHSCCPGTKTCGKCVRGLICHQCNVILGMANDDPEILLAGVAYLKRNLP